MFLHLWGLVSGSYDFLGASLPYRVSLPSRALSSPGALCTLQGLSHDSRPPGAGLTPPSDGTGAVLMYLMSLWLLQIYCSPFPRVGHLPTLVRASGALNLAAPLPGILPSSRGLGAALGTGPSPRPFSSLAGRTAGRGSHPSLGIGFSPAPHSRKSCGKDTEGAIY